MLLLRHFKSLRIFVSGKQMPELRRSTDPPPDPPSCPSSLLLLLHSVMQFKYFSEARLGAGGRLSVAVTARDSHSIVHITGKELESCPCRHLDINIAAWLSRLAAAAVVGPGPRSRLYK